MQSVERKSVEWDGLEKDGTEKAAFGRTDDWQVVEALGFSIVVGDPLLAKVAHFLTVYAWRERRAEVHRPSHRDYPCQRIGLEAAQFLN